MGLFQGGSEAIEHTMGLFQGVVGLYIEYTMGLLHGVVGLKKIPWVSFIAVVRLLKIPWVSFIWVVGL